MPTQQTPQAPGGMSDEMQLKLQALKEAEAQALNNSYKPRTNHSTKPPKYTSRALTPEEVRALTPFYVDLGPKPPIFTPKRAKWYWRRFKERRKLRKQLRAEYGVKKRTEFEQVAREVGLGIDNPIIAFLSWLLSWLLGSSGIASVLGASALLLAGTFVYSYITEQVGSFTIQLNNKTLQDGFILSDTEDFEVKSGRLISEELYKINAISIKNLDRETDSKEGSHNDEHSIGYTFYIKNTSEETCSYEYVLKMTDSMFNTEKAVWVMLFEDGKQIIYASPRDDGSGETLWGYSGETAPFFDSAYDPVSQYYFCLRNEKLDPEVYDKRIVVDNDGKKVKFVMNAEGQIFYADNFNLTEEQKAEYLEQANGKHWTKLWGINPTPTIDKSTVMRGIVQDIAPEETHKYTVVLWVEGDDPECNDNLFDGYAKYMMEFNPITDENFDLFGNVYRTEYSLK